MSKRAAMAFFLSLLVIIGYNYFVAQKYPAPTQVAQEESAPLPQKTSVGPGAAIPSSFSRPVDLGRDFTVETDLVKIVITSNGARIKSCQLKKYAEEKLDPEATEKEIVRLNQEQARAADTAAVFIQRQLAKQQVLLEKLINDSERAEMVSLAAAVDRDFAPAILLPDNKDLSVAINTAEYQAKQGALTLSSNQPRGQIEFVYKDGRGRKITKVYTFYNSNYNIGLDIIFSGWKKSDFSAGHFLLFSGSNVGLPQAERGRRSYGYEGPVSCFRTGEQVWVQKEKYTRDENKAFIRREHLHDKGMILWTGLENKYFLTALIPSQLVAESVVIEKNKFGEQKVALRIPWQGSNAYGFKLYLGPKKKDRLKGLGVSLEKSIDYGFFGAIGRLIYQILLFFSRWTHNFGWAIVLLCVVTKVVFYPLTHRSFESMQKMQKDMRVIQPEMDALRERLKGSPQKLNKEMMELYRKKGINPLASCQSGCLPLLLQMPVFFALYGVLYNSIELRGTPFIGWIQDLSAKDPYYVLPILMGVSMFVQQKFTGLGAAGGPQQEQAKIMNVMMPLLLTWIFAGLPSGVVLYWLTFNLVTALQQFIIRKKQPEAQT
jgi:YidC/Oxa1 family membrane protein insertase